MHKYISPLPDKGFQSKWPRKLSILGSTGSIGLSTLEVVRASKGNFCIKALAGGKNLKRLAQQTEEFLPDFIALKDQEDLPALKKLLPKSFKGEILYGQKGYEKLASLEIVDIVVSAQSGAAGLRGTVAAAKASKNIALANKESLVIAGELIRSLCHEHGASILPVDSEHNAIFQCLSGNKLENISSIVLTASGGPFFGQKDILQKKISPEEALKHPKWDMGAKISIDSATLMNKGLEVIEACHLFGVGLDKIKVLIHPQSIIHSLVEYKDGSQIAQLGTPDMRTAIAYCLNWPERKDVGVPFLDLLKEGAKLSFHAPDLENFPALNLAKKSMQKGQGAPAVLNAANEIAVNEFLNKRLNFAKIPKLVEACLLECPYECDSLDLQALLDLDAKARNIALELSSKLS